MTWKLRGRKPGSRSAAEEPAGGTPPAGPRPRRGGPTAAASATDRARGVPGLFRVFGAVVAVLCTLAVAGCSAAGTGSAPGGDARSGLPVLRIAAATELEDLTGLIDQAGAELGIDVQLEFPGGTLHNSQMLKDGNFDDRYDATWFATNRYLELIGGGSTIESGTSVATSPVALGIDRGTAERLGWTDTRPTWAEIGSAAAEGRFTFGMTAPGSSNSGLSALVSVANAYADTGAALQPGDTAGLDEQMTGFFSGQTLTAGSSGWLAERFAGERSSADALINYESVLHSLRAGGQTQLDVVVPADAVISADYPLSALANPRHHQAAELTAALAEWLLAHQDRVAETFRRPVDPATAPRDELEQGLIVEGAFPGDGVVVDELVSAFNNRWRPPGETTFVLDTSASMAGEPLEELQEALLELINNKARTETGEVGLRDRERVRLQPFNSTPVEPTVVDLAEAGRTGRRTLSGKVETLQAEGGTFLYDTLLDVLAEFDRADGPGGPGGAGGPTIPSVVVLTDGRPNDSLEDFRDRYAQLGPGARSVPVFAVLYGGADQVEMSTVAEMTGGKVFDARETNLAEAFKEIREYQ